MGKEQSKPEVPSIFPKDQKTLQNMELVRELKKTVVTRPLTPELTEIVLKYAQEENVEVNLSKETIMEIDRELHDIKSELREEAGKLIPEIKDMITAIEAYNRNGRIARLTGTSAEIVGGVAFSVGFNADDGTNGLPLSPHALLHFDRVITNVGNGYSTATGMFTAPVTGVYSFYISFMSVNGVSYTRIGIVKNGVLLDYAFADGQAVYDRGSTQVAVHLAKGDTVWAREEGGPAVRGGPYTIFTGFLVQAD